MGSSRELKTNLPRYTSFLKQKRSKLPINSNDRVGNMNDPPFSFQGTRLKKYLSTKIKSCLMNLRRCTDVEKMNYIPLCVSGALAKNERVNTKAESSVFNWPWLIIAMFFSRFKALQGTSIKIRFFFSRLLS